MWSRTRRMPNGCLEFTGYCDTVTGYGQITYQGKRRLTHRVAWEVTHGPIPDGLYVCHHCDNRRCVEPTHLFLGTAKDNAGDMVRKGRARGAEGEAHPKARLTAADVMAIRARYLPYQNGAELAAEFGISRNHLSEIAAGRAWRSVA